MIPWSSSKSSTTVSMVLKQTIIVIMMFQLCINVACGQSYEILFDTQNASGWFGGDNRTDIGPRDVGNGQSVLIDSAIVLTDFAFYFTNRFDYAENADGSGHEVTLVLNIRDSEGVILQTYQLVLPASFNGGWGNWSGIDLVVEANTTLIFTCYLVGAYDENQYYSGIRADADAGYIDGVRYVKNGVGDDDMEEWTGWSIHPWDANFWLQGIVQNEDVLKEANRSPGYFTLSQNHPNPFNPSTTIDYSLATPSDVTLSVYNINGQLVDVIHDGLMASGRHIVIWTASGLSSGVYFVELRAGADRDVIKVGYVK